MCIVLCWGLTHELPLPDAKKSPSLEKVTALTDASCPLKTDKAVIVIGSHNRTWCAQVSMRVCAQVGVLCVFMDGRSCLCGSRSFPRGRHFGTYRCANIRTDIETISMHGYR